MLDETNKDFILNYLNPHLKLDVTLADELNTEPNILKKYLRENEVKHYRRGLQTYIDTSDLHTAKIIKIFKSDQKLSAMDQQYIDCAKKFHTTSSAVRYFVTTHGTPNMFEWELGKRVGLTQKGLDAIVEKFKDNKPVSYLRSKEDIASIIGIYPDELQKILDDPAIGLNETPQGMIDVSWHPNEREKSKNIEFILHYVSPYRNKRVQKTEVIPEEEKEEKTQIQGVTYLLEKLAQRTTLPYEAKELHIEKMLKLSRELILEEALKLNILLDEDEIGPIVHIVAILAQENQNKDLLDFFYDINSFTPIEAQREQFRLYASVIILINRELKQSRFPFKNTDILRYVNTIIDSGTEDEDFVWSEELPYLMHNKINITDNTKAQISIAILREMGKYDLPLTDIDFIKSARESVLKSLEKNPEENIGEIIKGSIFKTLNAPQVQEEGAPLSEHMVSVYEIAQIMGQKVSTVRSLILKGTLNADEKTGLLNLTPKDKNYKVINKYLTTSPHEFALMSLNETAKHLNIPEQQVQGYIDNGCLCTWDGKINILDLRNRYFIQHFKQNPKNAQYSQSPRLFSKEKIAKSISFVDYPGMNQNIVDFLAKIKYPIQNSDLAYIRANGLSVTAKDLDEMVANNVLTADSSGSFDCTHPINNTFLNNINKVKEVLKNTIKERKKPANPLLSSVQTSGKDKISEIIAQNSGNSLILVPQLARMLGFDINEFYTTIFDVEPKYSPTVYKNKKISSPKDLNDAYIDLSILKNRDIVSSWL